jgi:hypothetical protein
MKLLKSSVDHLVSGVSAGALFSEKPIIPFYPDVESCPRCGSFLEVQKTWMKTVVTLDIGAFSAKETLLQCPHDRAVFPCSSLRSLVPAQGTYGFDVIVAVGTALFVHGRREAEIMNDLAAQNVFMSEREVGYLGRKFVVYLALAHRESKNLVACFMARRGGYVLHVDGTCEGDSPNLFCGIDGISEIVLGSVKIPSERKEWLVPFFRDLKKAYGNPVALVHDMGIGIQAAVEEVFPGIADFICHFHFLRDVGKDLLLEEYQTLMKQLRNHKVRASLLRKARYLGRRAGPDVIADLKASLENGELKRGLPVPAAYLLIHWAFASESRGYGFPFERPHLEFYRRLQEIDHFLKKTLGLDGKARDTRPYRQIKHLLNDVLGDRELQSVAESLEEKAHVFDQLREALRIALPEGKKGLNDNGESDIKSIEQKVTEFGAWLVHDKRRKETYAKMIDQLDKYWKKLFADPLVINRAGGQITIAPQRTNNLLERFFRGEKRRSRRKSGVASLSKTLKTMLAETPLVRNLENEEYRRILLNGCSTLAERFSQIDEKMVREQVSQAALNQERIPSVAKKIIKQPDLPQKILALYIGASKQYANCHLRS